MRRCGGYFICLVTAFLSISASAQSRALSQHLAPHELFGNWAILHGNDKHDACLTDYMSSFLRDGRYEGYFEEGVWTLSDDILTIKVLRSNYDTSGEGPMRRLRRPDVRKIHVLKGRGGQITFNHDVAVRC